MSKTMMMRSLDGLSVGDALGAQYFVPGNEPADLVAGVLPAGVWPWTDDTEMALSVVDELAEFGTIDQDRLVQAFAERCEPYRGYGPGTVVLLHEVRDGADWRIAARSSFGGEGSCGNGAAMRVAPLGGFFRGRPTEAADQARLSAEVTHAHPEGVAGAVAVGVAASLCPDIADGRSLLELTIEQLPTSTVRMGVEGAVELLGRTVAEAAWTLGNGSRVTAQDTVAFSLWVAATYLDNFAGAITACVTAGGDVDTTAAIVGGIVALRSAPPAEWLARREPLHA